MRVLRDIERNWSEQATVGTQERERERAWIGVPEYFLSLMTLPYVLIYS